jgi:hypothetical protein
MSGVFSKNTLDVPTNEELIARMKKAYPLRRFKVYRGTTQAPTIVSAARYECTEGGVLEFYALSVDRLHLDIHHVFAPGTWTEMQALGLAEDA